MEPDEIGYGAVYDELDLEPRMDVSDQSRFKVQSKKTPLSFEGHSDKTAVAVGLLLLEKIRNNGGTTVDPDGIAIARAKILEGFSENALAKIVAEVHDIASWLKGCEKSEGTRTQDSLFTTPDYVFPYEDKLPLIEEAIDSSTDIIIDYYSKRRGIFTVRRVTPTQLSGEEMIAFCHLRGDVRYFRLSRIRAVKIVLEEE